MFAWKVLGKLTIAAALIVVCCSISSLQAETATSLRDDLQLLIGDALMNFVKAKGASTYQSEDGHESFESHFGLKDCSEPEIWKRPSGELEFTCELVPNDKSLDKVVSLLTKRVTAIRSALPQDWTVTINTEATAYDDFLIANDPQNRLELSAHIVPYVDSSFSAGLSLTLKGEEAQEDTQAEPVSDTFPECESPPAAGDVPFKMIQSDNGNCFPSLTAYKNAKVLESVNKQLQGSLESFRCDAEGDGAGDFAVTVRSVYSMRDIFSVSASASYYCGTAYPTNDSNVSVTFDLLTGNVVDFEGLFSDYQGDKRKILAAIFEEEIKRSEALTEPAGEGDNYDCEKDPTLYRMDSLLNSYYNMSFTERGLEVQPEWPHVIEGCSKRVIVPYSRLKSFAAEKSLLARFK